MSGKLNRHVTVWRPNLSGWDPAWGGPNCKICLDSEPAVRPIVRGPGAGWMISCRGVGAQYLCGNAMRESVDINTSRNHEIYYQLLT